MLPSVRRWETGAPLWVKNMREQLITRQVTVKISDGQIVIGTVVAVDNVGLWIQLATDAAPPGVPEGMHSAVLFTPFSQILWAVTSINLSEDLRPPSQ
jgi:hypothetical protein